MTMAETPFRLLKVYPRDDGAFAARAEALLSELGGELRADPQDLERRLRAAYPLVNVRVQERLGMNGAARPHWYVFRDGRFVPYSR